VWLHAQLSDVARKLIGIDIDSTGVESAGRRGYEVYVADAQSEAALRQLNLEPADVVLAGEIIEHLETPGTFLRALHSVASSNGVLVLTTPNAHPFLNFATAAVGRERSHQDHVVLFTPTTLRTLLTRTGWQVEHIVYYQNQPLERPGPSQLGVRMARRAAHGVATLFPSWSDGFIVVARSAD
jgi:2-polyprenyl-3-methyl-5-hydroxy-6-metoxy-1,4-benzoquinol methylase